jgi:hypothetical protein
MSVEHGEESAISRSGPRQDAGNESGMGILSDSGRVVTPTVAGSSHRLALDLLVGPLDSDAYSATLKVRGL